MKKNRRKTKPETEQPLPDGGDQNRETPEEEQPAPQRKRKTKFGAPILNPKRKINIITPTPEEIEQFWKEVRLVPARPSAALLRHRRAITDAGPFHTIPGMPGDFFPIEDLQSNYNYATITKGARLAIDEYNMQKHTKLRFVKIENVGWKLFGKTMYYILVEALANGKSYTLGAKLCYETVGRIMRAISVITVENQTEDSGLLKGSLKELVLRP